MKTSLLFTLALGLVLTGCSKSTRSNTTATNDTTSAASTSTDYTANAATPSTPSTHATTNSTDNSFSSAADRASDNMRSAANSASNALGNAASSVATTARMTEWKLNPSDIQADLDHNREIVRTKDSAAGAPTGTSDKSVIESMVKGRLQADSDLAALKLDADADKDGSVKLSGKAHSAEQVGKAIALALDTEGVNKVSSKIKLDSDAKTNR